LTSAHRESVPQTAVVAVCGLSPSPDKKTRTANPAVRATRKKCLKRLICLHPRFPPCYPEAAMDTSNRKRPPKSHLCRSREKTRTTNPVVRATRRMKTNRRSARNLGSYEDNLRFPIRIEGNARGGALGFVFGRRRLAARVIPLVAQTAAVAVCGLCDIGRDFVPQTAAFAVCGRSSSPGEKTRTAKAAVRATGFPHPQAKRRGPQRRRSALRLFHIAE